jgi:hypothetical protein
VAEIRYGGKNNSIGKILLCQQQAAVWRRNSRSAGMKQLWREETFETGRNWQTGQQTKYKRNTCGNQRLKWSLQIFDYWKPADSEDGELQENGVCQVECIDGTGRTGFRGRFAWQPVPPRSPLGFRWGLKCEQQVIMVLQVNSMHCHGNMFQPEMIMLLVLHYLILFLKLSTFELELLEFHHAI